LKVGGWPRAGTGTTKTKTTIQEHGWRGEGRRLGPS